VVSSASETEKWIPAFAGKRPSHGKKVLGGIEKKYSGEMTEGGGWTARLDSRMRGN